MKKLTQEEYLAKANKIHGDKYDYSKTIYNNKRSKITITCPVHGDFEQLAGNHLKGQGCPECGKEYASTYSQGNYQHFLEESQKRFGSVYTFPYIESEYINSHSKITVQCEKCGNVFQKIAGDHLTSKSGGCLNCKNKTERRIKENNSSLKKQSNGKRKIDIEIIEQRIFDLCADKFIYDINEYKNTNKPITFKCTECGHEFKRDINALTYNPTCPNCNGKPRNRKYSNEEFAQIANEIHGNKYDYSETQYEASDKKITIICHELDIFGNEHGRFYVTPHSHIGQMRSGCPKCSGKHKKTTEEFIMESNLIHDFTYDYSKCKYINAKTKVCIICPEHGEFYQKPNDHLCGRGCPTCKQSKIERKIKQILKQEGIEFIAQYKTEWLNRMSIDIFIPSLNLGIEVQGLQHYKPVEYWGGEDAFQKLIARDKLKKKLCEENNVKLIYYSELNINLPPKTITNADDLLKLIKKEKEDLFFTK